MKTKVSLSNAFLSFPQTFPQHCKLNMESQNTYFCMRSVSCICQGNTRRKSDDRDEGRRRTEEREETGARRWGEDLRREDQAETRRRSEDREDGRRRMSRLRSGDSLVDDEVLDSENNKLLVFSNIFTVLT